MSQVRSGMPALDAYSLARTDSTCELNILARKLRDENAPPLSVDLTDMDGLAQVEKEFGEESSDRDEDAAGVVAC
jgi:hypothetical protein